MNPCFETANGALYCGKLEEVLPQLAVKNEENWADLVLSDPPYGTTACRWDSIIDIPTMFELAWQAVRNYAPVVLTASQPFTSILGASCPKYLKYAWVWEKNRSTGHVHAKNKPMKKHEDILVFSQGNTLHAGQSDRRMPYYPQGLTEMPKGTKRRTVHDAGDNAVMGKRKSHKLTDYTHTGYPTSILKFGIEMNAERFHPAQKPIGLFVYLISTYSQPGQIVLDFCAGSGTTAIAAELTGRKWVCVEKEEEFCEVIAKRLTQLIQKGLLVA